MATRGLDKLSDAACRNAKAGERAFKLADGGGLFLLVHPNGSKYWRWKYRFGGKEKLLALGVYDTVSLARARELYREAAAALADGKDPGVEKLIRRKRQIADSLTTFEAVARAWIEKEGATWSESYRAKLQGTLEANIFARIGALPIKAIEHEQLAAALEPIERRGALELVERCRRWCSQIYRFALRKRLVESDPAALLLGTFKARKAQPMPTLQRSEIEGFLRDLAEFPGRRETALAIRLLMLTFVRTGELRAARWDEFDLDRAEWVIPAERMKSRETHWVPLSPQAIDALRELQSLTGYSEFILPSSGKRSRYLSENGVNAALHRMGYKGRLVGHGFRAMASTLLNEAGWRPDVIERQLAHAERNKVRAAYNRAEYRAERREMMNAYADLLDSIGRGDEGKIVPIRRTAA